MPEIHLDTSDALVLIEYGDSNLPQDAGIADLRASFEQAQSSIKAMASAFAQSVKHIEEEIRPNEAVVEFGLKLNSSANWVVTKVETEASLKITFKWVLK